MFDYDANSPLNVETILTEKRGRVMVKEITYPSPITGKPIGAYLVLPEGEGTFPGILYVHWYEPHADNSNRTQFLEEAVSMAETDGIVGLLVETMWSDVEWYMKGRTLESDYEDAIRQVVELRRGLDVLLSLPQVDSERIAYVGHDFGAMYGSLMGGADKRPDVYVMIAGAANFNKWMLFGIPEDRKGLDDYKAKMEELAPSRFINQIDAPILFQFGTEDFYTPAGDIETFYAAAVEPKAIKRYKTEHAMALDEIRQDRLAFLRQQLGLT